MIRRILDTLAIVAFVAFLPLLAVAQPGVSAISAGPGTQGNGSPTTCSVAGAVWRTSAPAATLDCGAGLTYDGTTFAVTGDATISGSAIVPLISGSSAANGDITINGTTSATKTTSFVILQDTGGFVGIGATAPNAKLEVNDVTTNANGLGQVAVFSSDAAAADMGGKVDFGGLYSGGAQAVWAGIGGLKESSGADYAGYLSFRTRPSGGSMTQRMTIASTGATTIGGSGITGTTKALTAASVSGPDLHAGIPSKTLVDNTITTFATMALGNDTGGCTTLWYTVYAADATTAGSEGGQVTVCGTDVTSGAGGESCTASAVFGNVQDLQGSTLGVTFAVSTGTDLCNIRVTADTDIATPVSLFIKWGALAGGRTLTPQ